MSGEDMDAKRQEIAQRIRESREYLKLSQDDVAEVLGISRPAVTNIEQGNRKVEATELDRLSRLFGCTVDYLLGNNTEQSSKAAFLARSFGGLSDNDLAEVAKFAEFLRISAGSKNKPTGRSRK